MVDKEKAYELLVKLNDSIKILNLDMGGKHSYMLSHKSNAIITEIRAYLSESKEDKMIYVIYEYDKDYHKVVDYEVKEFSSDKKADNYCKENEGGGYRYFYLKEEVREKKNDRASDNIVSSL